MTSLEGVGGLFERARSILKGPENPGRKIIGDSHDDTHELQDKAARAEGASNEVYEVISFQGREGPMIVTPRKVQDIEYELI